MEGSCSDDRAFHLATLYCFAGVGKEVKAEQVERLWQLLVERTGPRLPGFYLAHLILRRVDWSTRFHDRAAVQHHLSRSVDVVRGLATLTQVGSNP